MRLDKFLKVSRLIKRRTVAKEVCEAGRIQVNGRSAKAGHDLNVGDILDIALGNRRLKVRIMEIKETVRADQADRLYEILEDEKITREEIFDFRFSQRVPACKVSGNSLIMNVSQSPRMRKMRYYR